MRISLFKFLIWTEIVVASLILAIGIPIVMNDFVIIGENYRETDLFMMVIGVTAFFYLTTGIATLLGHSMWRLLHYIVTAIACVLTGSLYLNMSLETGYFHSYYYIPAMISILIALLVVTARRKSADFEKGPQRQFYRKSILIVDDDESLLKTVRPILVSYGYSVLTATTGEKGLKIAQQQKPDLIILDVILPGIKGRDVCIQLKKNPETQPIPVIFLTAKDSDDDIDAEIAVGGLSHLTKPLKTKDLLAEIKKIIG